jgi:hypothetical protein
VSQKLSVFKAFLDERNGNKKIPNLFWRMKTWRKAEHNKKILLCKNVNKIECIKATTALHSFDGIQIIDRNIAS